MQQGISNNVDFIAKKLSLLLGCTIGLDSRGRNVFVCKHGIPFSISRLQDSDDWTWAKEKHKEETKE